MEKSIKVLELFLMFLCMFSVESRLVMHAREKFNWTINRLDSFRNFWMHEFSRDIQTNVSQR